MLISNETNPSKSVYYIGGIILSVLENKTNSTIDFLDLYREMNNSHKISLQLFLFSIDWLYLINKVKIDNKGYLIKCS